MNLFLEEKERLSEFRFREQTFYYLIVPKNLCPVYHCMFQNSKKSVFFLFCFHVLDWFGSETEVWIDFHNSGKNT